MVISSEVLSGEETFSLGATRAKNFIASTKTHRSKRFPLKEAARTVRFLFWYLKIMTYKNGRKTQEDLLEAFDKSETKSISEVCRVAGISRFVFYYHLKADVDFRRAVIIKQKEKLNARLATFAN